MKTQFAICSAALVSCLVFVAPTLGDPPKKAAAKEMVVTPGRMFTGAEFARTLSEHKLKAPLVIEGLAKKSAHPGAFDFSPGLSCNVHWTPVSPTVVDQVQWLGKHRCPPQVYEHVKVYFKEQTGDAAVFASLLRAQHSHEIDPVIVEISPSTVQQNSVPTLTVIGQNFTVDCYVDIDGYFLNTTFVNANVLTAKLTADVTGTIGQKEVLVHDVMTGGLSNSVNLTVKP